MTVPAPLPATERARLAALRRYAILDSAPDPVLDRITCFAARQFNMPIAVISLVDENRQWFQATCGLDATETGRDVAFCAHAILDTDVFVVPDAHCDPRFAANPLVTGPPHVRFYAGAQLVNPQGHALGTLCVIDTEARHDFSEDDKVSLSDLAAMVADHIDMRYTAGDVLKEVESRVQAENSLAIAARQLELFFEYAPVPVAVFDTEMRYLAASRNWCESFNLDSGAVIGRSHKEVMPHIPDAWSDQYARCLKGESFDIDEDKLPKPDGGFHWVRRQIRPWRDRDGTIGGLIVFREIITHRKEMEATLEQNRSFLDAVLQNVQDGIVACDAEGRLSLFNDAACRIAGLSMKPLLPEDWVDTYSLFDADGKTPLAMEQTPLFKAFQGEVVKNQEIVLAPQSLSPRRVVCQGAPLYDTNGVKLGAVASMHDVTSSRAAEIRVETALAEAQKSEAHLRLITDSLPFMITYVDLDLRYRFINRTGCTWYGQKAHSIIGRHVREIAGEAAFDRLQSHLEFARHGVGVNFDTIVSYPDGVTRDIQCFYLPDVDKTRTVRGIVAIVMDVTGRKQTEEKLRASEKRYRSLYTKTPVMLHSVDSEGRLLSVSDFWLEKLGYSRNEVIGQKATDFLTTDSARRAVEKEMPEFVKDGTCKDVEYQIVAKSGEMRDILLSAVADYDETGGFTRSMAVLTDVTERKVVERQLVQAQKMEMVGQLTGGLAHDFNNLLGVVMGNLQLLERSVKGNDAANRRIAAALGAVDKGAELNRRLLAFSRRQKLETQTVDPNPLIEGLGDLLTRTLGEAIALECRLGEKIPYVVTDPSQLESAVLNLAVNARDAMAEGGKLTIESVHKPLHEGDTAREEGVAPGDYVMLSVADSGSGIPADKLDKVFEPFFTTKEVGKGSGLGLSMVYGFIKQSGGHVRITSEVGCGTTIRLYLPVDTCSSCQSDTAQDIPATAEGGRETVLVVEDQVELREIAVGLLEDLGYSVREAENGRQALEALAAHDDIDLLFTDIVMPGGMDGTQVAAAARELRPDLPVLYATGYAEAAVLRRGDVKAGENLVTKPYRQEDLAIKLRQALDPQTNTGATQRSVKSDTLFVGE